MDSHSSLDISLATSSPESDLVASQEQRRNLLSKISPGVAVLTVILAVLVAYPLFLLVSMSFNAGNSSEVPPVQWGVGAYRAIAESTDWIVNSLIVAIPATIISTCLGAAVAWILYRTAVPARRVFQVAVYLPFALGPFISAFAWVIIAAPTGGLVNRAWADLTGTQASLVDVYSAPFITIVMAIVESPIAALIIGALMQRFDPALEESSTIMGATKLRTLKRVTLPLLLPAVVSATVILFSTMIGEYAVPAILGPPGRFYTAATAIYVMFGEEPPNYPLASALGVVLLAVCVIVVAVSGRFMRGRTYPLVTGKQKTAAPMNIGRWRFATTGFLCLYVFLSFVMPFGLLLLASLQTGNQATLSSGAHWTLQNIRYVLFDFPTTKRAVINTLIVAVSASTVCTLLAFLTAWLGFRSKGVGRGLLRQVALLPNSIPALVLALGIFWVVLQLPIPIFGTLWAVSLGFVIVFIPLAYQTVYGAIGSIHGELEEAARVAGARRLRILRTVTIPLLFPALVASWSLVFMASVRNVTIGLFLTETNTQVLGPTVISFFQQESINNTAALVMIQVLIIALAVVLLQVASRRRVEL